MRPYESASVADQVQSGGNRQILQKDDVVRYEHLRESLGLVGGPAAFKADEVAGGNVDGARKFAQASHCFFQAVGREGAALQTRERMKNEVAAVVEVVGGEVGRLPTGRWRGFVFLPIQRPLQTGELRDGFVKFGSAEPSAGEMLHRIREIEDDQFGAIDVPPEQFGCERVDRSDRDSGAAVGIFKKIPESSLVYSQYYIPEPAVEGKPDARWRMIFFFRAFLRCHPLSECLAYFS